MYNESINKFIYLWTYDAHVFGILNSDHGAVAMCQHVCLGNTSLTNYRRYGFSSGGRGFYTSSQW